MFNRSTMPAYRLFAAADLLLAAMTSVDGIMGLIEMAPERPVASRPEASEPFTQCELLEAMSMLARMGYLENRRPAVQ